MPFEFDINYPAETYRYKETPVYTASNGCPVRDGPLSFGFVKFRTNMKIF